MGPDVVDLAGGALGEVTTGEALDEVQRHRNARRTHTVGHRRQLLNLITYALGIDGLSMQVWRQGLAPPTAA